MITLPINKQDQNHLNYKMQENILKIDNQLIVKLTIGLYYQNKWRKSLHFHGWISSPGSEIPRKFGSFPKIIGNFDIFERGSAIPTKCHQCLDEK